MVNKRLACLLLALSCLPLLGRGAMAAQVESDAAYCFRSADFGSDQEPVRGICITGLPEGSLGAVMLGSRVLQPGDILTAAQVEQMTFRPVRREQDALAQVSYLPIYENRVETGKNLTISVLGKENKAPIAQDCALETYKNLPNEGKLPAEDPEGEKLTFSLIRKPRRGTVEIGADGSFVYTPKKNKVGVDSFTYTASDPAGKVSRTATVTIQILKPSDRSCYTDTLGTPCRFEAEWLKNTGLFRGEEISGQSCFQPEKTLSQGQFVAMTVKLLDLPLEETAELPQVPRWLRPYVNAALRAGLLEDLSLETDYESPVTGAQAAMLLQNALDLGMTQNALETAAPQEATQGSSALQVLGSHGIRLSGQEPLTRAQAAETLYRVSQLMLDAPGMQTLRKLR